jgi:deoxyribodipyrimidine photolyase
MAAPLPTRQAGLNRLDELLPRVRAYGRVRGYDRPHRPTVSGLSPWLQRRLLSEEEVCAAVLRRTPWAEAEKFVQEVCWRTYWKGWLEQHPEAWSRYRASLARLRAAAPPEGYERAIAGSTGIPGFDDWARQLVATGWLHNHARMSFASIWIFTLRLSWQLGADFFFRHLLDATWALFAHERLANHDPRLSLFAADNPVAGLQLDERVARYAAIGRRIDPWRPDDVAALAGSL